MDAGCIFIGTSWNDSAVSRYFRALGDEFIGRGAKVVYLIDGQRPELEDRAGNPAIYSWPSPRPVGRADAVFLWQLLKEYQPTGLITQFGSVNLMLMLGRLSGVPVRVAWYHTVSQAIDIEAESSGWKVALLRARKGVIYRLATHMVSISEAGIRDLRQTYGVPEVKCFVFPNLLSDPVARDSSEKLVESMANRSDHTVVCVGRLDNNKGQDVLIRALPMMVEAFPQLCVELIGDGPARAAAEELAWQLGVADHCQFLGRLPHQEVIERMAAAAVVVVPSRAEAFGIVNIEALAVSTPVVATAVGGIPEIIRPGVDGLLVPPDDAEALAEAIGAILGDAIRRRQLGHQARRRFLEKYDLKDNIGQVAEWYLSQLPSTSTNFVD
jgi:glycosyltransferase involved in cell wall biosynthesis